MEAFTPWTLFVDVGIVAALLLVGKLIRVKVKAIQKMFIPPSLIAGFLGLLLGPEGLDWLPFSGQLGTYAGILIALVFACLPFTSAKVTKEQRSGIGKMWAYSQSGMLFQWAFGGFLGILVLCQIWPLDKAFGISMPCGFCGGHGTAAAIGTAFQRFGNEEMLTLAMTAATVGILASVVIGMLMIKWATRKGHTSFLSDFSELPHELRTGLLPEGKKESMGESSCSSISIDGLAFNLAIICLVAFGGYLISKGVNMLVPTLEMPVFSCAFIFGILAKFVMDKADVTKYVSKQSVSHLSGTFTDFLVAFGIASIKLSVVLDFHRIPKVVEEILYSAMEDYSIDIVMGKDSGAMTLRIDLPPFTLVGATTRFGDLTSPLRDRFGIVHQLNYYTNEELQQIIKRTSKIFNYPIADDASIELAKRSRGTPRIANRLFRRIRDFAQYNLEDIINFKTTDYALNKLNIDACGLDGTDRRYLQVLIERFNGGPVGLEALAATISEETVTLEDVNEPYLLQEGFIVRSSRGRIATEKAYNHLNIKQGGML